MRKLLLLSLFYFIISCGAANTSGTVADDYGYSEKNPIKVGGIDSGLISQRNYLDRLTGPNGEKVTYVRLGSCCMFETKNSPFGGGMLDRYEITIEGQEEKKILYLNMYDKDKLYAPKGFLMK